MLKKLFALATMTAITGLGASVAISGCTSTTEEVTTSDAATDAKTDAKPKVDASEEPADTGPEVCPKPGDVTEADVQQAFDGPWKGPGAPKNVCTQQDIDKVKALFAGSQQVKFTDIQGALSQTCAACVFTPNSAANWGPLVQFSDGYYQNYAACYAIASNDNCGKNLAYFDICTNAVCDETECGSQQAVSACVKKAVSGGCKTFAAGIQSGCGSALDTLDAQCGNLFQLMGAVCGGGLDGGIDAAAPK